MLHGTDYICNKESLQTEIHFLLLVKVNIIYLCSGQQLSKNKILKNI